MGAIMQDLQIANASLVETNWDEKTWDGSDYRAVEGAKLTRVQTLSMYTGDLEGQGPVQFLMSYADDGTVAYVGLERFEGKLAGRPGSFVFQHLGTFSDGLVRSTWTVVPGSATGELKGLRGEVAFEAGHQEAYPITFKYWFE